MTHVADRRLQCFAGAATGAFAPCVLCATAKPSGKSRKMSSVAIASGVTAMSPSVRTSKPSPDASVQHDPVGPKRQLEPWYDPPFELELVAMEVVFSRRVALARSSASLDSSIHGPEDRRKRLSYLITKVGQALSPVFQRESHHCNQALSSQARCAV